MMTHSQLNKCLYQAMKAAAKKRKIKLSAEHDLYKKVDPYFFNVFYNIKKITDGKVDLILDISIKYHRFDELQYSIIRPDQPLRFTDKIRANSGALCRAAFPRRVQRFDYDGTEAAVPGLCEDILDYLEQFYRDFLAMVEKEYGDLGNYYIANRETMPRLAGLACLDNGDCQSAAACFLHPNMDEKHNSWFVPICTEEQRRRARANGSSSDKYISRNRNDQFADYAVALQNGLEWTSDRAMYGLLPEERESNAISNHA